LAGHWQIYQDNGFRTLFDLQQNEDGVLQGTGSYSSTHTGPAFTEAFGARPVSGATQGSFLHLRTDWLGNYDGQIASDGSVSGTTSPMGDPGNQVPWHVENRKAPCLLHRSPSTVVFGPPPPPPPPPKKTVTLGRKEHATATRDVDIYTGPDGNLFANVGFLRQGQVCRVLEGPQNGFYKLVLRPDQFQNMSGQNVTSGWVTADYLTVVFK
jgi:hypothetical protein